MAAISGVTKSATKAVTSATKARPMTIAIARSTTLPRSKNLLNPPIAAHSIDRWASRRGGAVAGPRAIGPGSTRQPARPLPSPGRCRPRSAPASRCRRPGPLVEAPGFDPGQPLLPYELVAGQLDGVRLLGQCGEDADEVALADHADHAAVLDHGQVPDPA